MPQRAWTLSAALLFVALAATTASPTSFPNPSCPDSVTIAQMWNGGACMPAFGVGAMPGDTVRGVAGIVTALDTKPESFMFYLQNRASPPASYSGLEVFTGELDVSQPPESFAPGDSVVVEFARTANFAGVVRAMPPNNNVPSPNIILRRVNSGNDLPALISCTAGQLAYHAPGTTLSGRLCQLVTLAGPLSVVRTNVVGAESFLVVSSADEADSVLVNGFQLTDVPTPDLGTDVAQVSGVFHRRTQGYEILLRGPNDLVLSSSPTAASRRSWGALKAAYH